MAAAAGLAARPGAPEDAIDGVVPPIVVTPTSAEAVAKALAWANGEELVTVIGGSGTKAEWGRPPAVVDVLVSMRGLSRVLTHAHLDLTATVEAGARLADVNRALARHGQWIPLDGPFGDRATIGGIVAMNDSGPVRHRYGTPRDQILGITVATVDGSLASAGGRVVKNVSGYDLGKLMAGSAGQLAAIVSATFKLAPLPKASTTVALQGDSPALSRVLADITATQLEPLACDLEWDARTEASVTLLVRFASVGLAVEAGVEAMSAIARQAGADPDAHRDTAEIDRWQRHESLVWSGDATVIRLSWLPNDWPRVFDAILHLAPTRDFAITARACTGAGLVRLGPATDHVGILAALRALPFVGHVVVGRGPTALRSQVDVWGPDDATRTIGRSIKRAWDPAGRLGGGRGPL
jgi:glycolate oxidase FAD binding subunit